MKRAPDLLQAGVQEGAAGGGEGVGSQVQGGGLEGRAERLRHLREQYAPEQQAEQRRPHAALAVAP